jgi:hypothetical protein
MSSLSCEAIFAARLPGIPLNEFKIFDDADVARDAASERHSASDGMV